MNQKLYKGKLNITVRLSREQARIFEEAASLNGFNKPGFRSDYLLYLLARDLTPIPGKLDYARGQLIKRLMLAGPYNFPFDNSAIKE